MKPWKRTPPPEIPEAVTGRDCLVCQQEITSDRKTIGWIEFRPEGRIRRMVGVPRAIHGTCLARFEREDE